MGATTKPVPADRDQPVAPVRSDLAALALATGIPADDVRAFLSTRYRLVATDIGLQEAV